MEIRYRAKPGYFDKASLTALEVNVLVMDGMEQRSCHQVRAGMWMPYASSAPSVVRKPVAEWLWEHAGVQLGCEWNISRVYYPDERLFPLPGLSEDWSTHPGIRRIRDDEPAWQYHRSEMMFVNPDVVDAFVERWSFRLYSIPLNLKRTASNGIVEDWLQENIGSPASTLWDLAHGGVDRGWALMRTYSGLDLVFNRAEDRLLFKLSLGGTL